MGTYIETTVSKAVGCRNCTMFDGCLIERLKLDQECIDKPPPALVIARFTFAPRPVRTFVHNTCVARGVRAALAQGRLVVDIFRNLMASVFFG